MHLVILAVTGKRQSSRHGLAELQFGYFVQLMSCYLFAFGFSDLEGNF